MSRKPFVFVSSYFQNFTPNFKATILSWGAHVVTYARDEDVQYDFITYIAEKTEIYGKFERFSESSMWPAMRALSEKNEFWDEFVAVNKNFAQKVVTECKNLGLQTIWIYGYDLILAANYIREGASDKGLNLDVAFYLDSPFPTSSSFWYFPWCEEVLWGLLANDVIAFQDDRYRRNFCQNCEKILQLNAEYHEKGIKFGNKLVKTLLQPLGTDIKYWEAHSKSSGKRQKPNKTIILAINHPDATNSALIQLKTFEDLLKNNPEFIGKVEFTITFRQPLLDEKLFDEIEDLGHEFNEKFGHNTVKLHLDGLSDKEWSYLYRNAEICMITPLFDTLCVEGQEFVACKAKDLDGILILSSFLSVADSMNDALTCNPYNIEATSATICRALKLYDEEKLTRIERLRKHVQGNDILEWILQFKKLIERKFF